MIAVTGAGGFIGSHLVEALEGEVRAGTHYSHGNFGKWVGDITDPAYCDRLIEGCEVCYHLAALIEIPYSYKSVKPFIDTNIVGTYNILEACKRYDCKLVHVSSSEVYGTGDGPMNELTPVHPQSPYAATKLAADCLVQSYWLSYNLDATIIRPFNTFGPRQSLRAFIPHAICGLLEGHLEVGNLSPWRDYTYVTDTVAGIIAGKMGGREVYNLGAGMCITMRGIVEWLQEIMGTDVEVKSSGGEMRPLASEVFRLESDNTKAKVHLGWQPKVKFEDGLKRTVEYYRESYYED